MRHLVAVAAAAVIAAAPVGARGEETKDSCASASEDAQSLQRQGKLLAARQNLLVCTRTTCPSVVKQDCDGWLTTLDALLPSLVVAVHDDAGKDVVRPRVLLDGAVVDTSSGRAVPVDPGVHQVHVEAQGKATVDQSVVVHEGERARPLTITLASRNKPPAAPAPSPERVPVSPFVYVLGTLAAVGVAGFFVFEVKASSDATHLHDTCAPRCAQSDVDSVSAESVVANISLVAGAVLAAATLAAWLLDGHTSRTPGTAAASPAPGGFALRF
jgi:hypothetical protein